MNDYGLSLGLDNSFNVSKWIHLNLSLDYTYFLIRKAKSNPSILWDQDIPRNMLSASIGVGINFGNPHTITSENKEKGVFNSDKNSLTAFYSMFNFFDKSGFIPKKDIFANIFYPIGVGLQFEREFQQNKSWYVSIIGGLNIVNKAEGLTIGDLAERQFATFNFGVSNNIFNSKRQELSYALGLTNRIGYEEVFIGSGVVGFNENGEPLLEGVFVSNSYLDLGTTIGLRYQFNLNPNIHLKSDLTYTFYPITIDQESTFSPHDNGTPRNQVMFNIGLGINFGKNETDFNSFGFEGVFVEKFRSFQVGVFSSFYSFFDGTPLYEKTNKFGQTFNHLANSYGLEFGQQFNDNWKWIVSVEDFEFSVLRPFEEGVKNGKVLEKNFMLFSGSILQKIVNKKQFALHAQYGFNYRKGSEIIIGKDSNPDPISYDIIEKNYSDFGLFTGLRADYILFNRINIGTRINYTFFPSIAYKTDGNYEWNHSTSRNMLSYGISIGFVF